MIRIVTDSSSDLPLALAERHRVEVVPLTVRFGDESYLDRHQLSPERFRARLQAVEALPEIGSPSAGAFVDAYQRLAAEDAEGIVAVCGSSGLSATYQAAVIAAEKVANEIPVRVVDSQAVSMALGLVAVEAAETASAETSLEQVAERALAASASTNLLVALDTLEMLRRGQRVGRLSSFLAGLVDVKPLVTLIDGVVDTAGRVRGRTGMRAALTRRVAALGGRMRRVAVLHSGGSDLDQTVAAVHAAAPHLDSVEVAEMGPVLETHTGAGALGIAYQLG